MTVTRGFSGLARSIYLIFLPGASYEFNQEFVSSTAHTATEEARANVWTDVLGKKIDPSDAAEASAGICELESCFVGKGTEEVEWLL